MVQFDILECPNKKRSFKIGERTDKIRSICVHPMEIIEEGFDDFINSIGSKRDRGVNKLIKYLTTNETCSHTMHEKHSSDK